MSQDIHYLGLLDVSDRIRRRELTSEAVTQGLLARIERHESRLNSVLMLLADAALEQARQADAEIASGFWRGPLHGVPLGFKDLLWTKGVATTAGMELLKDFRPEADATVITRLRRAGAVLIAKLHMTEGATLSHHPSLPRPVNPWSAEHWTGVSSSGSGVATAAGFCYGALATDTGGSIRMPSSANSVTGIKPTWGRVSRYGLIPLSESDDHIGPMARSAEDAAAILQAIAGADLNDPTALSEAVPDYLATRDAGVSDLVVGVDWRYATEGMTDEIVAAVRNVAEVLADRGARIREVNFSWTADDAALMAPVTIAAIAAAHAEHYPEKADRYGSGMRFLLEQGQQVTARAVVRGLQARARFNGRFQAIFRDVDMLLTPGLGGNVPTWDEIEGASDGRTSVSEILTRFTRPFSVAGTPTISLPGGFTEAGLPVGIQLVGRHLGEPDIIRAGMMVISHGPADGRGD